MRVKKHRLMPVVVIHKIMDKCIGIEIRRDAMDFVVDNAMGYMIYKVPNYSNWVDNDTLEDPFKLLAWLDKHEADEEYRNSGCKLPEGKWQFLFTSDKVDVKNAKQIIDSNEPDKDFHAALELLGLTRRRMAILLNTN